MISLPDGCYWVDGSVHYSGIDLKITYSDMLSWQGMMGNIDDLIGFYVRLNSSKILSETRDSKISDILR